MKLTLIKLILSSVLNDQSYEVRDAFKVTPVNFGIFGAPLLFDAPLLNMLKEILSFWWPPLLFDAPLLFDTGE